MSSKYLLDSSAISHLLSDDEPSLARFEEASVAGADFYLCAFVYFEITRGFLHEQKPRKQQAFQVLLPELIWTNLELADWELGAHLWAMGRKRGREPGDGDALIAAAAMNRSAVVVTANEKHFRELPAAFENWRAED
ncbi:MAG: PIN domain-containing protein [Armatimonadia bacterium]|nr:PIN domain-containing protein [Armatimonadia bacterium]